MSLTTKILATTLMSIALVALIIAYAPTTEAQSSGSIDISGLVTSMEEGTSDSFTVDASNLDSSQSYSIQVTTSNSDIGFNSSCSDTSETEAVPAGSTSYSTSFTLHACDTSGGTVTTTLLRSSRFGTITVDTDSQDVSVIRPSITISSLDSSMDVGDSDSFTVEASDLDSRYSYSVRVQTSNEFSPGPRGSSNNIGFNSSCSDTSETATVSGSDPSETFTLYGCNSPGGTVIADLRRQGTLLDTDKREVIVREPPPTNDPPNITSGSSSVSYGECRTGSVATYSASDPDGDSISWSLPNTSFETDRGDFDISSSGVLTFESSPDYEDPDDSNDDNVYKVTVRASDGNGGSDDRNVTVTVTNRAPTITSGPSSVSYAEGGTSSVGSYGASDPCGGAITWSLPNTSFETDRGDFDISSSGILRFENTPDYEDSDDHNDDNVYKITVRASDGSLTASRDVTVTVTNEARRSLPVHLR